MAEHNLTAVGFEPTQLALVELESTPLDHSGKLSWCRCLCVMLPGDKTMMAVHGQHHDIKLPRLRGLHFTVNYRSRAAKQPTFSNDMLLCADFVVYEQNSVRKTVARAELRQ